MKIVVCIKQVPDTTEVRLNPETGTLIRDGIPSIINPDDKSGLEAALKLKDEMGAHITAITMGPPQAELALREALAMGADEAILVTDRKFGGADTWATSMTLAAALRQQDYDLIIAGRQAIDGDTAQVGPQIAEKLDLPQVSYVGDLKYDNDALILKRIYEDGHHILRVKLPCLITTLSDMNTPRFMSVGGIFDAWKQEIKTMTFDDLDIEVEDVGLKGSPTRVKKSFTKAVKEPGRKVELPARESAEVIYEALCEKYII